jgi:acyltransferase
MDALILMVAIRRPLRFIMYYKIFRIPVLRYIFKSARAIPIAGRSEDAALFRQSFEDVHTALADGDIVAIFPEGELTRDGEIGVYRRGIEKMLERDPVPVIPVAIDNLWGSLFSHAGGLMKGGPRKWFARIDVLIGAPLPPETDAETLKEKTLALLAQHKTQP